MPWAPTTSARPLTSLRPGASKTRKRRIVANTAWWEQFDDPVLNELIQIALQENKDLKIAAARIEQFVGQYVTTRAALFPQIGAGASGGVAADNKDGVTPAPVWNREQG